MLMQCPECELQVSDKATFCPHCGYPIQPDVKPRKPRNRIIREEDCQTGSDKLARLRTGISGILTGL